jgi:hypothetical protein
MKWTKPPTLWFRELRKKAVAEVVWRPGHPSSCTLALTAATDGRALHVSLVSGGLREGLANVVGTGLQEHRRERTLSAFAGRVFPMATAIRVYATKIDCYRNIT